MNKKRVAIVAVVAALAFVGGWLSARGPGGPAIDIGDRPVMVMYQTQACGCCSKWATHQRENGFLVEVHRVDQLNDIREREGITAETAGCHTAFVEGYLVEGHVPAHEIQRLLRERPDIKGVTVPGMPIGSPGMEGTPAESYDVLAIAHDGTTSIYASY